MLPWWSAKYLLALPVLEKKVNSQLKMLLQVIDFQAAVVLILDFLMKSLG